MDFGNRVAIVTGGASGIGAAAAELLNQRGARVSSWTFATAPADCRRSTPTWPALTKSRPPSTALPRRPGHRYRRRRRRNPDLWHCSDHHRRRMDRTLNIICAACGTWPAPRFRTCAARRIDRHRLLGSGSGDPAQLFAYATSKHALTGSRVRWRWISPPTEFA